MIFDNLFDWLVWCFIQHFSFFYFDNLLFCFIVYPPTILFHRLFTYDFVSLFLHTILFYQFCLQFCFIIFTYNFVSSFSHKILFQRFCLWFCFIVSAFNDFISLLLVPLVGVEVNFDVIDEHSRPMVGFPSLLLRLSLVRGWRIIGFITLWTDSLPRGGVPDLVRHNHNGIPLSLI